ncbi:MAG: hypothetical protein ACJ8KA_09665 [Sulfurifustis sp.]
MKINTALVCFVVTILGGSLAHERAWCAGQDDTKPKMTQASIAAKGMEEVCVKVAPPESLRYAFTATGQLNFSVHYHAGDNVHFPVPGHVTSSEKNSFTPTSAQDYCLMWENTGSEAVDLRLEYEKT